MIELEEALYNLQIAAKYLEVFVIRTISADPEVQMKLLAFILSDSETRFQFMHIKNRKWVTSSFLPLDLDIKDDTDLLKKAQRRLDNAATCMTIYAKEANVQMSLLAVVHSDQTSYFSYQSLVSASPIRGLADGGFITLAPAYHVFPYSSG